MKTAATAKLFGTDTLQGLTCHILDKTWAISDEIKCHFTLLRPFFMNKTNGEDEEFKGRGIKRSNYQAIC
ncbi:hypothetical protein B1L08_15390 [Aeromonas veronii]|nr:hypothetical protein [Aeromonas veronii]